MFRDVHELTFFPASGWNVLQQQGMLLHLLRLNRDARLLGGPGGLSSKYTV